MDILVNADQWNQLNDDEKDQIVKGLREVGALKIGFRVVPDANTTAFASGHGGFDQMWDPIGDACRALCDTAAATGVIWCHANTAGVGLPVCLALVAETRKKCRGAC